MTLNQPTFQGVHYSILYGNQWYKTCIQELPSWHCCFVLWKVEHRSAVGPFLGLSQILFLLCYILPVFIYDYLTSCAKLLSFVLHFPSFCSWFYLTSHAKLFFFELFCDFLCKLQTCSTYVKPRYSPSIFGLKENT